MASRTSDNVVLPKAVSTEIWADAAKASAVMSLATPMTLPGAGVSVPMITGDVTAAFVAEGAKKPTSEATFGNKVITPYKIAVIQPFTDEFRRDLSGLYAELANRLPSALAVAFDKAVFHGPVPGSGFDTLADADNLVLDASDTYGDLVAIESAISGKNGVVNGWALAPKAKSLLNRAVDGNDRPLFLSDVSQNGVSTILGGDVVVTSAVYKADAASDDGEVLGFAGDWTNAYYGTVEGVQVSMADQATVTIGGTPVNLWEHNMFALRAEIEVGFAVRDINKFVKITGSNTVA